MSRGKRNSLSQKSQFDRVFKEGAKAHDDRISVIIATGTGQHGLIVPKAIGNAVTRNRWRRQLRPLIQNLLADNRDIVILVRKGETLTLEHTVLEQMIEGLFTKAEKKLQQKLKQEG